MVNLNLTLSRCNVDRKQSSAHICPGLELPWDASQESGHSITRGVNRSQLS